MIMRYAKIYGFTAISLRFFNVYGPRSKASSMYSGVISAFVKQKSEKKPLTIVGDGLQTRSFVYVLDIVSAMIKAAKSKLQNTIFNVGSEKSICILNIAKILGGKKIYVPKRSGEPRHSSADIRLIKKKLRWKPKFSLKKGIKITYSKLISSKKNL